MTLLPRRGHIAAPRWLPWFYSFTALGMLPWVLHLDQTLSDQHSLTRWAFTWVGFDIGIICVMLGVAGLAICESMWLNLGLTALATLLLVDPWFDILTASGPQEMQAAVLMAGCIEIPLALASLVMAVKLTRQLAARRG